MSKVAITGNASGTGTLTIAAPNTNTDYTLTLPQGTGEIALSSTVKIIQTQQIVFTTQGTLTVAPGSLTAIPGLTVSITPTSASNKILVTAAISLSNNQSNTDQQGVYAAIYRNNAIPSVIGAANGSALRVHGGGWPQPAYSTATIPIQFLDSPATTSQVTYSVLAASTSNNTTISIYYNRTNNPTSSRSGSTICTLTVQEIVTP
jgi:hypothetical protein